MTSYNIILSSESSDLYTSFDTPIHLNPSKTYTMALVNIETYHSFPNVDSSNNQFTYTADNGKLWQTVTIPEGSYEITDLNNLLKASLAAQGHQDVIELQPNLNTLKCVLTIKKLDFAVSFEAARSLRNVLGFGEKIYRYNAQPHEGVNNVNIMNVNSILVHCDVIGGSYVNGQSFPTLFSFFPNVPPGYKIVQSPHNLVYLPVTRHVISDMRVWLTDQNNRPLNLRGETVTVRLHLKE